MAGLVGLAAIAGTAATAKAPAAPFKKVRRSICLSLFATGHPRG
jgi:hypothetical protein